MSEVELTMTVFVIAAIAGGLNAGVFYAFTCAVMPGLRQVDDRAFVLTMQSINRRIVNPVFLIVFVGAPVLAVGALVVVAVGGRSGLWAAALAVVFSLLTVVMTGAVNVPLNNALDASGDPDHRTDLRAVRSAFESRWVRWNVARTVTSTAAFGSLVVALV